MKDFEKNPITYTKPVIVAQNKTEGSYAAGCPANYTFSKEQCRRCERTH